ncbi:conjugal transfer protein, partial [Streptococcus suis]
SANQHETLFFTIVDMSEQEITDLGLNYREEVELTDIVVTYSAIGRNDNYRLYASGIKKKGATPKDHAKA